MTRCHPPHTHQLFPDEGGKRSNKKLVDHVFDEIDRDGGGTITAEEFKSFCMSKIKQGGNTLDISKATPNDDQTSWRHHAPATTNLLDGPTARALDDYDELVRELGHHYRRQEGIQQDLKRMESDLHLVQDDIIAKEAKVNDLRTRLDAHRSLHTQELDQCSNRIRELDSLYARMRVQRGSDVPALSGRMGAASSIKSKN